MSFIKSLLAFILGICLLFAFYYWINIPAIPSIYIYVISSSFADDKYTFRRFFLVIGTILGVYFYGANAVLSIINYPKYLNVLGIIFEFITCFVILSTGITLYSIITQAKNKLEKI